MKIFRFVFLLTSLSVLLFLFPAEAAPDTSSMIDSAKTNVANPKDVASSDAILAALYEVISGPSGQKRDWDRMRSLFLPGGRLVGTGRRPNGEFGQRTMSVEDYISMNAKVLEERGFFENEIGRHSDTFGNIVQVFSTYEARWTLKDEKPFMRGINSVQLWNDGKRWWIITVFWQSENPEQQIPERYLKKE